MQPRYLIGIDLGTTQCAVAYCDLHDVAAGIRFFPVPQLVSATEMSALPTLPSTLYLPDPAIPLARPPWDDAGAAASSAGSVAPVVGQWARELGLSTPARYIHSAKSWLCHPQLDRTAPLLPWQSEVIAPPQRLSPVTASTWLLRHLVAAWDHVMARDDRSCAFARQRVVVTVPASFDPVARNLTLQAIRDAGLTGVTLLEEPQAAFYDHLYRHRDDPGATLRGLETALVIDVGGGTSDFSLIGVDWAGGAAEPNYRRVAVGPHLLIGGDNLDLAIAHAAEHKLRVKRGQKLVTRQWLSLLGQARTAKEQMFTADDDGAAVPAKVGFTVLGAGSKVVARTVREELEVAPLREQLLGGFFPLVAPDARPEEEGRLGLSEAGLPYSRDAAITRHLAAFLADQKARPDAVLFNGGTMCSPVLRRRLVEQLTQWRGGKPPRILDNPHPTLAVASGAVAYGMVLVGLGRRIESGNPSTVYIGVGTRKTTKGKYAPEHLVCLLPRGAPSEQTMRLAGKTFGVDRQRDVAFYLYTAGNAPPGEIVGATAEYNFRRHKPLPPLVLRAATQSMSASDPVQPATTGVVEAALEVVWRETGFLQLYLHELANDATAELNFDLTRRDDARRENTRRVDAKRDAAVSRGNAGGPAHAETPVAAGGVSGGPAAGGGALPTAPVTAAEAAAALAGLSSATGGRRSRVALTKKHAEAVQQLVDALFAPAPATLPPDQIFKRLEDELGAGRKEWDLPRLRALADLVLDDPRFLTAAPAVQVPWFRLLGFCLRPGFGAPDDGERLDRLWSRFTHPFAAVDSAFWAEWWLLWKRVAPGLDDERQVAVATCLTPYLFPPKKPDRDMRKPEQHERDQMWRLLGHLERVPAPEKARLGGWIIQTSASFARDALALYALGRMGTRQLVYATPTHLVPAVAVGPWVEQLLRHAKAGPTYLEFALRELGRKTGDRLVQIDDIQRKKIVELLKSRNRKKSFMTPLLETQGVAATDFAESCGDELPSGFVWVREESAG